MSSFAGARRPPRLVASIRADLSPPVAASVATLDERGCTVELSGSRLRDGQALRIQLDEVGPVDAEVERVLAHSVMVRFAQPLHAAVAAMLRAR